MTHPNTDQGVTAGDLEARCLAFVQEQSCGEWGDYIEQSDAKRLTAFVEAEIASLKQRLESAEDALRPFVMALHEWGDDAGQPDRWNVWEHPIANGVTLGDFRAAATFLQQQEKQNG